MPVEKNCERCGSVFRVKPSHAHQRFCSKRCVSDWESQFGRPAAQMPEVIFTCKVCGNPFGMKPSYLAALRKKWKRDPWYCSIPCASIGRKADAEARAKTTLTCIQCGKPITDVRKPSGYIRRGANLCSTECRSLFRRLSHQTKNPDQEPTRRMQPNGYWRIYIPGKDGQPPREVFEHRYVMEQHIGRELLPHETVHHVNGDRGLNTIENLELFSSRHGPGQRVTDKVAFALEMLRLYPEFIIAAGGTEAEHQPFNTPP